MENELDRINNRCILERLLHAYHLLYTPALGHGLAEYGCALSYQFEHLCVERQLVSLRELNVVCARLFSRNLAELIAHNAGFWAQLQRHADRAAACIEYIARDEARLMRSDFEPLPVTPIVNALLAMLRAQPHTPLTPVLRRLINFHRLLADEQDVY